MKSDQINELATALAKAQAELKPAPFDKVNPHFKSRYASLASCVQTAAPTLAKYGLAISQVVGTRDRAPVLVTTLMHTSGQWLGDEAPLFGNNPQQVGASLTYSRRQNYSSIIGLISEEDDDGESASRPQKKTSTSVTEGSGKLVSPEPSSDKQARGGESQVSPRSEEPPRTSSAHTPPLSKKQLGLLHVKMKQHGWNKEAIRAYSKANFGKESATELTWAEFNLILQVMERNPVIDPYVPQDNHEVHP
jgi:hypothetical protein